MIGLDFFSLNSHSKSGHDFFKNIKSQNYDFDLIKNKKKSKQSLFEFYGQVWNHPYEDCFKNGGSRVNYFKKGDLSGNRIFRKLFSEVNLENEKLSYDRIFFITIYFIDHVSA